MPSSRARQPILYADQLWRQQRFFAGFLIAVGLVMTILLIYQGQIREIGEFDLAPLHPERPLLGGAFLLYKRRSYVEAQDAGVKVGTLRSSVLIDYNRIRGVRVQPLKLAFQDRRSRMVAPMMKPLMEKPAMFRAPARPDEEVADIKKVLGSRMMFEDTIALPVLDADAVAWEISSRLPVHLGLNQEASSAANGGGERKPGRTAGGVADGRAPGRRNISIAGPHRSARADGGRIRPSLYSPIMPDFFVHPLQGPAITNCVPNTPINAKGDEGTLCGLAYPSTGATPMATACCRPPTARSSTRSISRSTRITTSKGWSYAGPRRSIARHRRGLT